MIRKLFVYILILVILSGLGAGAFYFWDQYNSPSTEDSNPDAIQARLLSEIQAISPNVQDNSQYVYYGSADGRIYRNGLSDGSFTELPIASMPVKNVKKISWSPVSNDFIVFSVTDSVSTTLFYSATTKEYTRLADNVLDFDWYPDGLRIAMIWQAGDKKSQQLVVSNPDGTGYRVVANLPSPDYKIKISPTSGEALLISSKRTALENKIYLINLTNGEYRTAVATGNNLEAKWLNGNQFLYTRFDKPYPRLYKFDLAANTTADLGINTELSRVAFDGFSKQIVAAVKNGTNNNDKIIRLNPDTAQATDYFSQNNLSIKSLVNASNTVLFVSGTDNKLYQIK